MLYLFNAKSSMEEYIIQLAIIIASSNNGYEINIIFNEKIEKKKVTLHANAPNSVATERYFFFMCFYIVCTTSRSVREKSVDFGRVLGPVELIKQRGPSDFPHQ